MAAVTELTIQSDGAQLAAFVARPNGPTPDNRRTASPGLVVLHGFPSPQRPGQASGSYRMLGERITDRLGLTVLGASLRGCGVSSGQFSLNGWLTDVHAAVGELRARGADQVWVAGSTTGGSLAVLAGAADPDVAGVATIAARADFDDWAGEPSRFLQHCRDVGVVTDERWPDDLAAWTDQLRHHRPLDHVGAMGDRPLLVLHGQADRQVPAADARALADAHGSAEVRLVAGGDHRLRHDPRAIAVLFGWLARQTGTGDTGTT